LPPLNEQAEIVARIGEMTDRYETLTTEAQRAIDLPQERRTTLIPPPSPARSTCEMPWPRDPFTLLSIALNDHLMME
jgi:hypothetical protein